MPSGSFVTKCVRLAIVIAATFGLVAAASPEAPSGAHGAEASSRSTSTTLLRLYDHICDATWYGGALRTAQAIAPLGAQTVLPCPGSDSDDRGFVRPLGANFVLENGARAERAFQTHPMWVSSGYIFGSFPLELLGVRLQTGDRFVANVGFLTGAAEGRVRFSVWFDSSPGQTGGETMLAEREDTHDGDLETLTADLGAFAGVSGALLLRVDALESSAQDWAVWVEARIEREVSASATPTLTPTITPSPSPSLTPTLTPTATPSPMPIDLTPPRILTGPLVTEITTSSATICWQTDEASDSLVAYDDRAGLRERSQSDGQPVVNHCLLLSGLTPSTAYHFQVESKDAAGNGVTSLDLAFETASEADEEMPTASLDLPDTLSGETEIPLDATDNIGIDRVVFFVDGHPVLTDYTSPFALPLDTGGLADGEHEVIADVTDLSGHRAEAIRQASVSNHFTPNLSPVHVSILNPAIRSEVYGWVEIQAEVTHDYDAPISRIEFRLDGAVLCPPEEYRLVGTYFNPESGREEEIHEGRTPLSASCAWDFATVELRRHVIEVLAWDRYENAGQQGIMVDVAIPGAEEMVELERRVTRHGNWFEVELIVTNTSGVQLRDLSLVETSVGFQAVRDPGLALTYDPVLQELSIAGDLGTISPGARQTMRYSLVPVLFDPPLDPFAYHIGRTAVEVSFQDSTGRAFSAEVFARCSTDACGSLRREVREATQSSDYLIVTNPHYLFDPLGSDPPDDPATVNELLATMAELAKAEMGVLGYLREGETNDELRGLISPCMVRRDIPESGLWHMWMPENWWLNGYLLIVGETEIVPAYQMDFLGMIEADGSQGTVTVNLSDNTYADLCGEDGRPELRVGRIIGDTAANLIIPLRTSLDVGTTREWDRSDAFLVSGYERPAELPFISNIEVLAGALRSQGVTVADPLHTEYFDTEENVLREALTILCTYWDFDDTTHDIHEPPAELSDLEDLVDAEYCPQVSSLILAQVYSTLNLEQATRVWAVARGFEGTYTTLPTPCEVLARRGQEIRVGVPDRDLILWSGHGWYDGWSNALDANVGLCGASDLWIDFPPPIDFGAAAPVVIAASCLTGHYEPLCDPYGSDCGASDYGMAEAFLRNGAAVYIGCTRSLDGASGHEFQLRFVRDYWSAVRTVGEAFVWLKNALIDSDETDPHSRAFEEWLRVSHIFNLFGDPKFGRASGVSRAPGDVSIVAGVASGGSARPSLALAAIQNTQPPATAEVHIPEYTLSTVAGLDYLDIPGGNIVLRHGQPRLPSYTVSFDYPEGTWVQDVTLHEMGGMQTIPGLNLPLVNMTDMCGSPSVCAAPLTSAAPLEDEFRWHLSENPDGSARLMITVFPLVYDAASHQAELYRDYTFDVRCTESAVQLTGLSPQTAILRPGETVDVYAWLENSGPPQDVYMGVVIRRAASREIVAGLPMRLLRELTGKAVYTPQWDSTGAESGLYVVEATVSDAQGTVLDRRTASFALNPAAPSAPEEQAAAPASVADLLDQLRRSPLVLGCFVVAALGALAAILVGVVFGGRARKRS